MYGKLIAYTVFVLGPVVLAALMINSIAHSRASQPRDDINAKIAGIEAYK